MYNSNKGGLLWPALGKLKLYLAATSWRRGEGEIKREGMEVKEKLVKRGGRRRGDWSPKG